MRAILLALCAVVALSAAEPPAPSYKRLVYPPLIDVKLPHIETATLPNGMKLYLLENHELPIINGFAIVRTGNLFDPSDKVGLAGITGSLIRSGGTKNKTGEQLDVELENLAASVESSIGESNGSVSFSTLKRDSDPVLQIFHDVLCAPEFRQDKIDLVKTQSKGGIARRDDDAQSIPGRELDSLIYGRATPYGWRSEIETIDRIQRKDVADFYRRYFFPSNVMLAIEGDFNSAEMKRRIETLFADWTVSQPAVPPMPKIATQNAAGVYFLPRTDVTQTFFALGQLGGTFEDKDFPALQVMSDILGGSFSSRLFRHVRTQLGYAYDIGASWGAEFDHPGLFVISGSTKAPATLDTLRAIRQEVDRIQSSEVTDAELETSKQTTINSFVFNFDSASKTLNRLITYAYYGYPADFLTHYQDALKKVTKADVLRVAKQYLKPKEFTYIAVGNPKELGKPLSDLGIPVMPLYPETSVGPPTTAGNREAAVRLLQRMQKAMGGAEKIAAIEDATFTAEAEMRSAAGTMKAKQTARWVRAGGYRQDQDLPFGKLAVYADARGGWMSSPQGTMPLPPPVAKQMQYERFRYLLGLILSDASVDRKLSLVNDKTVEISGDAGVMTQIEIDPATGLPSKESYPSSALGGGLGMVEERYGAWKQTSGGVSLPYTLEIYQNGNAVGHVRITSWAVNSGLTSEELNKKP